MSTSSLIKPVLVVGAGPTGLIMALELTRRGIPCRIIDKLASASDKSKALGIMPRTLEALQDMGIHTPFLSSGLKVDSFNFHIGRESIHYLFAGLDSPYPYMIILPQNETERILAQILEKKGISIERGVELENFVQENNEVIANLKSSNGELESAKVSWLIGCDGAKSRTRKILGADFQGSTYPESFALGDVNITGDLNLSQPHFFISEKGQWVIFPIPGGYQRIIIIDMPQKKDKASFEITLADLQSEVDARSGLKLDLQNPRWLSFFQIHKCLAERYRKGRAFLVGDAAHIHSPAGGQGMNTGIQDAYNLAWKLSLVIKGLADDNLLDSYEKERRPVAEAILKKSDGLTRFMAKQSLFHRCIRKFFAKYVLPRELFRKKWINEVSQLKINYRKSPIVGNDRSSPQMFLGLQPGDKAVDVSGVFLDGSPERRHLFELIAGKEHLLLLFSGESSNQEKLSELLTLVKQVETTHKDLIDTMLVLSGDKLFQLSEGMPQVINDPRNFLHEAWGMSEAGFYFIRPDKYVAFRGTIPGNEAFLQYLSSYFRF